VVELTHTPLHSPHASKQSRPAFFHKHLIVEQPVLHEHLIISFGAIGIKLDPVTLKPQLIGGK